MRVCLYAHNWHYLSVCNAVQKQLSQRGIESFILILRFPGSAYFDALTSAQERYGTVRGFKRTWYTELMLISRRIPLFGSFIAVFIAYIFVRRFLRKNNISVLATTDDRAAHFSVAIMRAALKEKVVSCLIPVETLMLVKSAVDDKLALAPMDTVLHTIVTKLICTYYPAGVHIREGRDVFFYQTGVVASLLFWKDLLPRNPWVRGSHPAISKILVNSRAQAREDILHGIDEQKIFVTGFPMHDIFANSTTVHGNSLKDNLRACIDAGQVKKVFLIIGTHLTGAYEIEKIPAIHNELRRVYATIIRSLPPDWMVVMKLHPQSKSEEQRSFFDVEDQKRVVFIQNELTAYDLMKIADGAFLFTSSVVMSGMATDIPLFAYKLDFPSFDSFYERFTSVACVRSVAELDKALSDMAAPLVGEALSKRIEDRATMGMFDGKNATRCADEILKLVTGKFPE